MFPMEVNVASIRCWQGRLEVTPEGLGQDQGFFVRNLRSVCLGGFIRKNNTWSFMYWC